MHLLRFLSRAAFICNSCFLLAMVLLWLPKPPQGELVSLVIVLGIVLALILNGLTNAWLAILLFGRDKQKKILPPWLAWTNFIFFILQLIFILK